MDLKPAAHFFFIRAKKMPRHEWSSEIVEIGDSITQMTLTQAVELGAYLESAHGIKAAFAPPALQEPEKPKQEAIPVQTEFSVMYDGFDPLKKIGVIKVVREITGLGIKEAKEFVENNAGKPIREGLPKADADILRQKLELAGAKISIK